MTNGERYKIFKAWFDSVGFPEMHASYKDAMWQGFEAGHRIASKTNEAAPELLGALIKLVDVVDDMVHGPSTDAAHAAINKALGETK